MPLLKEQVEHIARLARLNLPPDEIEPHSRFIKVENVFRVDKVHPSLPRGKALGNAPDGDGGYFLVPGVIR